MLNNTCMIIDDDEHGVSDLLNASQQDKPKRAGHFRGWRSTAADELRATRLFGNSGAALASSDFPLAFQSNKGGGARSFEPKGAWRVGFPAATIAVSTSGAAKEDTGEIGDLIMAVRDSFRISPEVASIIENGIKLLPLKDGEEGELARPHTPEAVCGGELARPHTPTYADGSPYDPVAEAAAALARQAGTEAADIARVIERQR